MDAFGTAAWVERLNAALVNLSATVGADDGLVAREGTFTVLEEIRGGPDGDLHLLLRAVDGAVRLELAGGDDELPDDERADVTLVLDFDDAVRLADGTLTPAAALTEGRVKVRGDLGVLVAGQRILAAAQDVVSGAGEGDAE